MQSVYSNLRLPIELWAKVFINVSSPLDLASLSAVCADLHIEAERCLYHTVSVTSSQGFLRFAQAVAVSSRRAATVKSLRVDATHVFPESSCVAALRHLQLLESLDIRTYVTGVPDLAALADLCFPCLRVFAWSMPSDGAHVFAFLTRHRDSLEQLTIQDSARRRPAPARLATLPHLRALAGPYSATNHIDAANLTHLDLHRYPIIGLPILAERFGATLVALRLAGPEFIAMNEPLWTLGDLATKFSRLRCLALCALGSDVDSFTYDYLGFDWDAAPRCGAGFHEVPKFDTRLTLVWTTPATYRYNSKILEYQSLLARTAARLLEAWTPYLGRCVYWHEDSFYDTYACYTLGTDDSIHLSYDYDSAPRYFGET